MKRNRICVYVLLCLFVACCCLSVGSAQTGDGWDDGGGWDGLPTAVPTPGVASEFVDAFWGAFGLLVLLPIIAIAGLVLVVLRTGEVNPLVIISVVVLVVVLVVGVYVVSSLVSALGY